MKTQAKSDPPRRRATRRIRAFEASDGAGRFDMLAPFLLLVGAPRSGRDEHPVGIDADLPQYPERTFLTTAEKWGLGHALA